MTSLSRRPRQELKMVTATKILHGLAPLPLLLVSLLLFGGVIALGVVGILRAGEVNTCDRALPNVTECQVTVDLTTAGSGAGQDVTGQGGRSLEFVWLLLGSSGCGLAFSVVFMFAVWVLIEVIRWFQVYEENEKKLRGLKSSIRTPLTPETHQEAAATLQKGDEESQDEPDGKSSEHLIDIVGEDKMEEWEHRPLRHFSPGSLIALFLSIISFTCALLCLLWSIALAFDHVRRTDKTVSTFIGVEILAGLALPTFLFVGGTLLAIVLDFITFGNLDPHQGLTRFIPGAIKYEKGRKNDYWVIEDTFYFRLKKRDKLDGLAHDHDKDVLAKYTCFYSCDKNLATWHLAAVVALSMLLAISYFVDITIDQAITVGSCLDIPRTYDCFNVSTLAHVDCRDNLTGVALYCFRFLQFGVDQDIIAALSQAFAFYLLTVQAFVKTFSVVKVFLHVKPTRFWGALFLVVGVILFIAMIIVSIIWIRGYISPSVVAIIRLNVINLAQFIMICLLLINTGALLLEGRWWERNPERRHKQAQELIQQRDSSTQVKVHLVEEKPASELGKQAAVKTSET